MKDRAINFDADIAPSVDIEGADTFYATGAIGLYDAVVIDTAVSTRGLGRHVKESPAALGSGLFLGFAQEAAAAAGDPVRVAWEKGTICYGNVEGATVAGNLLQTSGAVAGQVITVAAGVGQPVAVALEADTANIARVRLL